jgi:hypothetical protein
MWRSLHLGLLGVGEESDDDDVDPDKGSMWSHIWPCEGKSFVTFVKKPGPSFLERTSRNALGQEQCFR